MALGSMIGNHRRFLPFSPFLPIQYSKLSIFSLASAFAFAFFSGVKTPLYKMVRAYGTWIDDW